MSTCEKYKFELNKPCSCSKCSYHINSGECSNCLFIYLKTKGTKILINEASRILGIDRNTFKSSVVKAINESRVSKLDSVIGTGNEFEYVPNSNICVVCGQQVFRKKWLVGNIAYCSRACQQSLPPTVACLMNRLGIDERTLLFALVQCFSGVKICELLQLKESEFKKWVFKLCGIKLARITDYMPLPYEPKLDKPIKINNKNHSKFFIFNNDKVFKDVADFISI